MPRVHSLARATRDHTPAPTAAAHRGAGRARRSRSRIRAEQGFTLIELLVVILVIAILIAVAAPSFLGQQDKAKDSGVKQELTVAYKAAKSASLDSDPQGAWPTGAALASSISASEPQLDVQADALAAGDKGVISVDGTSASTLTLTECSGSGTLFALSAPQNGAQKIADGGDCAGSGAGDTAASAGSIADAVAGQLIMTRVDDDSGAAVSGVPLAVYGDGDLLYRPSLAGGGAPVLARWDSDTGATSRVAGTGAPGDTGDGGPASSAQISAVDAAIADDGTVYLLRGDCAVRAISTADVIDALAAAYTTEGGSPQCGGGADVEVTAHQVGMISAGGSGLRILDRATGAVEDTYDIYRSPFGDGPYVASLGTEVAYGAAYLGGVYRHSDGPDPLIAPVAWALTDLTGGGGGSMWSAAGDVGDHVVRRIDPATGDSEVVIGAEPARAGAGAPLAVTPTGAPARLTHAHALAVGPGALYTDEWLDGSERREIYRVVASVGD